jgi:hypothetical protein
MVGNARRDNPAPVGETADPTKKHEGPPLRHYNYKFFSIILFRPSVAQSQFVGGLIS